MPLFMVGRVLADGWNVGVVTPTYGERNLRAARLTRKTNPGALVVKNEKPKNHLCIVAITGSIAR
jgi:hypothetical protein